jgi:hypothetical protein
MAMLSADQYFLLKEDLLLVKSMAVIIINATVV